MSDFYKQVFPKKKNHFLSRERVLLVKRDTHLHYLDNARFIHRGDFLLPHFVLCGICQRRCL